MPSMAASKICAVATCFLAINIYSNHKDKIFETTLVLSKTRGMLKKE